MSTVYLVDITGKGMSREALANVSDQEFVKLAMTKGSIFSLEHFVEEFNAENHAELSMATKVIRII